MVLRFDIPRVHFCDLRLRYGAQRDEILFDPTPLKALFAHNKIEPDAALQLSEGDLCQLMLAWYLEYRSLGGQCAAEVLEAICDLRDGEMDSLRPEVELLAPVAARDRWILNLRQRARNVPRGIFSGLVAFAGKLAGFERVEPAPLPLPLQMPARQRQSLRGRISSAA